MRKTHEARKSVLEPEFTNDEGVTHPTVKVRPRTHEETQRLQALVKRLDTSKVYRIGRRVAVRKGKFLGFEDRVYEVETSEGPVAALRLADVVQANQCVGGLLDPREAW